jgi:hypothetical protein
MVLTLKGAVMGMPGATHIAHSESPTEVEAIYMISNILFCQIRKYARCQWLMPVILATWEAGIRRIAAPGQARQKSLWDPISPEKKKLEVVAHACHCSYGGKFKIGVSRSRPAWAKVRLYLQNNQSKEASSGRAPV